MNESLAVRMTTTERAMCEELCWDIATDFSTSDMLRLSARIFRANVMALQVRIHRYLAVFKVAREADGPLVQQRLLQTCISAIREGIDELALCSQRLDMTKGFYWCWAISEGTMVRFGLSKCGPNETLEHAVGCVNALADEIDFAEWLGENEAGIEFLFGASL